MIETIAAAFVLVALLGGFAYAAQLVGSFVAWSLRPALVWLRAHLPRKAPERDVTRELAPSE